MVLSLAFLMAQSFGQNAPDAWIDLKTGWRFQPDPSNVGLAQQWYALTHSDEGWAAIEAGSRWEDQGFPDVEGYAWYRQRVDVPASWAGEPVWLVLGGVSDTCIIFCNGNRVNSFGDAASRRSMHFIPIVAELNAHLRFGEPNLIAIQCYDFGVTGGLWRSPCVLTTDATQLPLESLVACYTAPEERVLSVAVDLTSLGNERPDTLVQISVSRPGTGRAPFAIHVESLAANTFACTASFHMPEVESGDALAVNVALKDTQGNPLPGPSFSKEVSWPEQPKWPGEYASLKVLNNFVTELLNTALDSSGSSAFSFPNPREGWVFFSISGHNPAETPRAVLNDNIELVWRGNPGTRALESMRLLTEGEHRVKIEGTSRGRVQIRTIPEMAYCYYPGAPHIAPFGPYNWAFVERYVLPHVNTLITRNNVRREEFDQWLREGRQWISNASLPGLESEEPPPAETVYEVWAANPGVTEAGFSGIIVDEFVGRGSGHYQAWSEAVRRLHAVPSFQGKTFYAWCGDLFREQHTQDFSRLLMELGHKFVWERYLREEPTPEKALQQLYLDVQQPFQQWKTAMPGVEDHMVVCLGYLCAPPESLNLNPAVNYHVWLDMQFRLLATDPTFWRLHGVMEYMSNYADEESIRWAHNLFRHYCIEGKRTPLVADPYRLPHVENPDFADGLAGWEVEAAEAGAVEAGRIEGFSWLQGRYPLTREGDAFCRMRRSQNGPNRIKQTIQSLEPGRLYSLKLIAADLDHLHDARTLPLTVDIVGVERAEELSFQFTYPSCYSHEHGPYTREHPAHFDLYRVVFRAKAPTAELVISDWLAPTNPGGPMGQQLAFNFVEVQPFLDR